MCQFHIQFGLSHLELPQALHSHLLEQSRSIACQPLGHLLGEAVCGRPINHYYSLLTNVTARFLVLYFPCIFNFPFTLTETHQISEIFCFAYSLINPTKCTWVSVSWGTSRLTCRSMPSARRSWDKVWLTIYMMGILLLNIHYSRIVWGLGVLNPNHLILKLKTVLSTHTSPFSSSFMKLRIFGAEKRHRFHLSNTFM